jgi:hypothetical protein
MKKCLFFLLILPLGTISLAQSVKKRVPQKQTFKTGAKKTSLNGQWRGFFDSKGDIVSTGANNTEYVLELNINGSKITGYSYSYFQNRSFYVICSLDGVFDKTTKTLTINETARIKGATPPGWSDCLQTHTLVYKKEGSTEELTGKWSSSPGQIGDCGFGNTTLIRKTLSKNLAFYNKSKNNTAFSAPTSITKKPTIHNHYKTEPPVAKVTPKPNVVTEPQPQVATTPTVKSVPENVSPSTPEKQSDSPAATSDINFENRNNDLLQTVKIENATVRVDLYDNGVVDGDSISVFYNGKLILSHQRLSEQAITLTLNVNTNHAINELIMYAENLGEIPPNTALMVVTDGDNRYEVPITSDLKNSGVIRFIYTGKK